MSRIVTTRGRACVGKRRYHAFDHAKADAIILRRRIGHPVNAYPCPYCNEWHVGKTPWWVREGLKAAE